jgi:hypothetical protein
MVGGLVIGGHVHLSQGARAISKGNADIHAVEKRFSRHLASEPRDMSPVAEGLLARSAALATDDTLIVADWTDLTKPHARRQGAGPKSLTRAQPDLPAALDALVEPTARADPESPLRWTCRSVRKLAEKRGWIIRVCHCPPWRAGSGRFRPITCHPGVGRVGCMYSPHATNFAAANATLFMDLPALCLLARFAFAA